MSETREPAHCVEVKPIVSARPGATQGFIFLENSRRDSAPLQRSRRGKTRCSSADNDDSGFWHDTEIPNEFGQYKINFTPATISTRDRSCLNTGGGARLLP